LEDGWKKVIREGKWPLREALTCVGHLDACLGSAGTTGGGDRCMGWNRERGNRGKKGDKVTAALLFPDVVILV